MTFHVDDFVVHKTVHYEPWGGSMPKGYWSNGAPGGGWYAFSWLGVQGEANGYVTFAEVEAGIERQGYFVWDSPKGRLVATREDPERIVSFPDDRHCWRRDVSARELGGLREAARHGQSRIHD